jgi:hypothetical protein
MGETRRTKLIGACTFFVFCVAATAAISWDRRSVSAVDADSPAALASAVAKARADAGTGTTSAAPVAPSSTTPEAQGPNNPEPQELTKNPLYLVGPLPASKCKEPSARPTSVALVRAYYNESLACLNKSWAPVIRKAGFQFRPAHLVVSSGQSAGSPCDTTESAYYCGDETIYMDADLDIADYQKNDRVWVRTEMAFLIAHEYAHHVQRLTGILHASSARQIALNGIDAQLEETRRVELQASCLSGVYLGADRAWFPARGTWLRQWQWTVRNTGDEWNPERTHGNKKNHGRWSISGFDAADLAACNTFTAAPSAVS